MSHQRMPSIPFCCFGDKILKTSMSMKKLPKKPRRPNRLPQPPRPTRTKEPRRHRRNHRRRSGRIPTVRRQGPPRNPPRRRRHNPHPPHNPLPSHNHCNGRWNRAAANQPLREPWRQWSPRELPEDEDRPLLRVRPNHSHQRMRILAAAARRHLDPLRGAQVAAGEAMVAKYRPHRGLVPRSCIERHEDPIRTRIRPISNKILTFSPIWTNFKRNPRTTMTTRTTTTRKREIPRPPTTRELIRPPMTRMTFLIPYRTMRPIGPMGLTIDCEDEKNET